MPFGKSRITVLYTSEMMMAPTTHVVAGNGAQFFVYGTLMAEQVVTSLLGRMPSHTKARVMGYTLHPVRDVVYPAVIPVDDIVGAAAVEGLLLQDLAPGEMRRLDWYEGTDYKRVTVLVELLLPDDATTTTNAEPLEAAAAVSTTTITTTKTTTSAFMYQWDTLLDRLDTERPWDYEAFVRNHLPEYVSAAAMLPARQRMLLMDDNLFPQDDTM
jgi:gamma-glutamylcyclotransferase (GGCT)/AIG2-like uncharacterized protein YtfP